MPGKVALVTMRPGEREEELPGIEAPQRKVEMGGGRARKVTSTIAGHGSANLQCVTAVNPHNHCVRHGLLRPRALNKSSEAFSSISDSPRMEYSYFWLSSPLSMLLLGR